MPDFSYEKKLWKKGFKFVAGADEVGRGSWMGPVVAACVIFDPMSLRNHKVAKQSILNRSPRSKLLAMTVKIDDSKKLNSKQREKAEVWVKENCLAWGIGEASVTQINRFGMGRASRIAFRKAIVDTNRRLASQGVSLQNQIDFLLIDAFYLPYTKGIKRKNQLAIIKGDAKSYSIAAASIIAKVYRDELIQKLGEKHPEYGWERNKGYGTKEHQAAILKYGPTRLHRRMFMRKILEVGD